MILNVSDRRVLDLSLSVEARHELVTVEMALLSESPAAATIVDQRLMENQPLNGRSFQRLIELSPGVTVTAASLTSQGQFRT